MGDNGQYQFGQWWGIRLWEKSPKTPLRKSQCPPQKVRFPPNSHDWSLKFFLCLRQWKPTEASKNTEFKFSVRFVSILRSPSFVFWFFRILLCFATIMAVAESTFARALRFSAVSFWEIFPQYSHHFDQHTHSHTKAYQTEREMTERTYARIYERTDDLVCPHHKRTPTQSAVQRENAATS